MTASALSRRATLDGARESTAVFLAPALAVVVLLAVFPLGMSLVLSFSDYRFSLAGETFHISGLANWRTLLHDGRFWHSLGVTVRFVAVGLTLQYLLGLGLALLLHQRLRGVRFYRGLFLLPMLVSPVAASFIVGKMMLGDEGPVNDLLGRIGISGPGWLSDPGMVVVSQALVDTWEWTPLMILLLYAARATIPREYYEAAAVDGASPLQSFWRITMPLLVPISLVLLALRGVLMFQSFDVQLITTRGGPGGASETLSLYAYRLAFGNFDLGYAATVAYAQLVVLLVGTALLLGLARRRAREVA